MRLLLTHAYFVHEDPKELRIMKPYPPLGILYLSSHLRSRGFEVDLYDSTFGSMTELTATLHSGPPGILGIGVNLMTRVNALHIIGEAKAAGWKVVVGGPEPAHYAAEYLAAGADVVVRGEAELTLEELIPALEHGAGLGGIAGIIYSGPGGKVSATPDRALIPDLDRQPWPDRERIDIGRYLQVWRERHGTGSVSLITARGCPYSCRWCSHSTYGHTHRRRSARGVAEEVAWILERYSPEMLWFADDVFTIHHGWLEQFAGEMRRRSLRIPFECITRADRVNERVAGILAALGCFRVWIGSESGSQRILDAMDRGVTVEQVQRAVELCRAHGIATGMFLMWGYEGETVEDVEATIEHVKRTRPDVFFTTVSYPIRGTPYYEEVSDKLVQIGPWAASTDRDLQIAGRPSREFYQDADRLLRSEVALLDAAPEDAAVLRAEAEVMRARLREPVYGGV